MTAKRILIVEDDTAFADLLCRLLESKGYETRAATDGYLALKLLPEFSPHLICLDIYMPHVDGLEFLKHYRARTPFPVPIIVFSANDLKGFESDLAGVEVTFQKPFDIFDLLKAINSLLDT